MKGALVWLYLLLLGLVLPADAPGPRQLCDKPDFREAYYNGHLMAAAPGTSLTLTCKEGYKTGYPTTTCRDGQWTTPTPPCELVKCQYEDLDTSHVLVDYDCLRVGCVATLTCSEGYWYDGPKTKTCRQDGTWSGPIVTCQVVKCEKLTPPPYGWIQQSNRGYLAVATMQCDEGYTYSHPDSISRQCQANNTWSGLDGTCIAIQCPKLIDPPHGKVLQVNRSYLAVVDIMCDEGYRYTEPSYTFRQCQANKTWSGKNGICQVEPCPELAAVDNGVLSESSGSRKLECNDGYKLKGISDIYCMSGGKWSADIGNCEEETNLTGLWALVLVPLLIALGFSCYCYWPSRRPINNTTGAEGNDAEIALLSFEMYVYITVKNSFGGMYVDEGSRQYTDFKESIERQVLDEVVKRNTSITKIEISGLRKPNRMSLRIICQGSITEEAVCAALKQLTPIDLQGSPDTYNFVCESADTKDTITDDLKLQILRGKHIPDNENDFEIDLETQYVDLRVIRPTGVLSLHKFSHEALRRWRDHGEDITDEEIIKKEKGLILLLGRAGVGKSTLMQKLARKWANGFIAVHLKAVFFLNLRFLISDKKKMTFSSLVSMLPTYINVDNIVHVDGEWLNRNQALIAIMLDGLDEIGKMKKMLDKIRTCDDTDTPLGWCFRLLKREHLPDCTLLLSTRSPEDVSSIIEPTEVVEVMGLPDTNIPTFIKKNVKETQRQKVKTTLTGSAILRSISSITFYCAALCRLLQEDERLAEELITYTRITAYLLEMYICRSSKDGHTQEDMYDEMGSSLQSLSQLASNGLVKSSLESNLFKECYTEDDIEAAGIDNSMKAKLQKAGLLLWIEAQDAADSDIGQFAHLSIQQYMAMAKLFTFNPGEINATLKTLLSSSSQFNMALLYLVGLAFNDEENATSRTARAIGVPAQDHKVIREALTKAAIDLAATPTTATASVDSDLAPNPVVAIQMVHESQSPEFACEVGIHGFRHGVKLENTKLTLMEIKGLTFLLRNCSSITNFELKHVAPDFSSIQEISQFLVENESIKEASLVGNTIDGNAIKELLKAIKENKYLEKLKMSFSRQIGEDIMTFVADALSVNTTLKELWLAEGILRTCDVSKIREVLQNSTVRIRMSRYEESTGQELKEYIEAGTLVFEEQPLT